MAHIDHTSPSSPAERREGGTFIPLGPASQHSKLPRDATLYLNPNAPANALYDAAEYRLKSLIDLLTTLELAELTALPNHNLLQLSRSLLLLASDAQSLYQANQQQRARGQ